MPKKRKSESLQHQDSRKKYNSLEKRIETRNERRNQRRNIGSAGEMSRVNISTGPVKRIVNSPELLPDVPNCKYCDAKRIYLEPLGFCCSSGQTRLLETKMPQELVDLYLNDSEEGRQFRNCIRSYNNMFAFTSLGVHCDKSLATRNIGIYTFRVQGQVYHFMDQLIPSIGEKPKNLQLYFFDTDHEISNRMCISPKFSEPIVKRLLHILEANPYAIFFRSLQNIPNLNEQKIILHSDPLFDERVFNKPTVSQVAGMWLEPDSGENSVSQHIQVYPKQSGPQIIKHYFGCYDPLQYPLIFPTGDPGWHRNIMRLKPSTDRVDHAQTCDGEMSYHIENFTDVDNFLRVENERVNQKNSKRRTVSCREYYCYKLQMRAHDKSFLLHVGRLLQQYVIDMYIKIETSRLDFFRSKEMQNRLRNDVYSGLLDSVTQGYQMGHEVGRRLILPPSFIGGPRDMRRRYMDAIALVQRYGKPDIFLTMTSNPNWPEIKALCLPLDEIQNRPDLITRIFRAKLQVLKEELFKKNIFGNIIAYTYVIEFQKRGLPHAHFLLILSESSKTFAPEAFDNIVCAELPDPEKDPYLFSLVTKHMIHGPCGILDPSCPCMKKDTGCKFNYPKEFSEETKYGTNTYPIYRRRKNGLTVNVRGSYLDNRWVVPYNPYLLSKFNCHINVEICSTIQVIKYIYKYLYKGHDRILCSFIDSEKDTVIDEIKNFQRARWISPPEAVWRIFGFDLNQTEPSVIALPVHLENQQSISFNADERLDRITNNPRNKKTMLTQFFFMNNHDDYAKRKNCLYIEFPEYFTWHGDSKEWEPRKKHEVIGRITTCHPSEGERFYLRLLLLHIRKPTSFKDLRTIHGQMYNSYKEAAHVLGLMEGDSTSESCLQEAAAFLMPSALRQLFATVLVYCNPENPGELWLKYQDFLSDDFSRNKDCNPILAKHKTLDAITYHLYSMGKKLEDFPFLNDIEQVNFRDSLSKELQTEYDIVISDEDLLDIKKLNREQKIAYDRVMYHVNNNLPKVFFIDGPGGSGKTFLYKTLLTTIRSKKEIALATATSGVAASLLPGGRTSHSRFKIPLDESDSKSCSVSKQSTLAYLLRIAKLIIWDEATMAKRSVIEKFDELLKDVMSSDKLFGGKIVLFGGDFRQTLPVILKGTKEDVIDASIIMSPLWSQFEKLKLKQNMRALLDYDFSAYLLRIGNGIEDTNERCEIHIPAKINIGFQDDITSLNTLIDFVFPDIKQNFDTDFFVKRAILTTRNEFVHEINDILIDRFPGEEMTYLSHDESSCSFVTPDQVEIFHSLTPQGFPPYKLVVKKNAPIILLRNLNPTEGLCNGTRMICKSFDRNIIFAEISVGPHVGKPVFIPRITLEITSNNFTSIPFKRKQFPVRLCFAMTINKAQGQTLDYVGVYLKEPVFSHGQLYVALSRAKTTDQLKVLIRPITPPLESTDVTKNVVYDEILAVANIH